MKTHFKKYWWIYAIIVIITIIAGAYYYLTKKFKEKVKKMYFEKYDNNLKVTRDTFNYYEQNASVIYRQLVSCNGRNRQNPNRDDILINEPRTSPETRTDISNGEEALVGKYLAYYFREKLTDIQINCIKQVLPDFNKDKFEWGVNLAMKMYDQNKTIEQVCTMDSEWGAIKEISKIEGKTYEEIKQIVLN